MLQSVYKLIIQAGFVTIVFEQLGKPTLAGGWCTDMGVTCRSVALDRSSSFTVIQRYNMCNTIKAKTLLKSTCATLI